MNYNYEIANVENTRIIEVSDIYDFSKLEYEKFYQEFFDFCRENLDIHIDEKNFRNAYFLYTNYYDINAMAVQTEGDDRAILINMGLIHHCINKYLYNVPLNDFIEEEYSTLTDKFDSSVSYLAYQLVTQFTYYHELAHLFQLTKLAHNIELQERGTDDDFDIVRHKLEINADTYGAISLATHIDQYIRKVLKEDFTQEEVENTISIFGACLLEYILSFNHGTELYYKEKLHPHALIRMMNIVLNFVNHLSIIEIYKEKGLKLEPINLYKKITHLHNILVKKSIFEYEISYLDDKTIEEITPYVNEVRNFEGNDTYNDAMFFWNRNVQK